MSFLRNDLRDFLGGQRWWQARILPAGVPYGTLFSIMGDGTKMEDIALKDKEISMARTARVVIQDVPHHITHRGNNRSQIFFSDSDRERYLSFLKVESGRYGLAVLGYSLMTNHIHLVATPSRVYSLAEAIGRAHYLYAYDTNLRYGCSGHLWGNRFHSCPLDMEHFWKAMIYVEQNPVRAKMVELPWEYQWSSASAHIGLSDPPGLLDLSGWAGYADVLNWKSVLLEAMGEYDLDRLRSHTFRGYPLANDRILSLWETLLGRRLRPRSNGRPKKKNPVDNTY